MPNSSEISTSVRTPATPALYNNLVKDAIRLLAAAGANKTIATGEITVTPAAGESQYQVDTEGSAASDDLVTINGGAAGDIIGLVSANVARVITLVSGSGNIVLKGAAPVNLDTVEAFLLRYNGTNWTPYGGGGGSDASSLTNKSGGDLAAGDVVIFDTTNDTAFMATTTIKDLRVMGVLKSAVANNVTGPVFSGAGSVCTVNCDSAAVGRGQFLTTSSTLGKATAGSYFREPGVFAIALTSKAAGSAGTVTAMLVDNFRQAIIGTLGYNMGGYNGSSVIAATERMTIANETWAVVTGAALPVGKTAAGGMNYGTIAAYCMLGSTTNDDSGAVNTRYKVSYSTDTASTLTAGTARNNHRSGINFAAKGFVSGGVSSSSTQYSTSYKTNFATDAETAGTNISSVRQSQGGISDGTYAYIAGSAVTCDKIDNATETPAADANSALGNGAVGYCFASFAATYGFRAYNNGSGTVCSRRMPFSTGVDANNGSSPTGNIAYAAQVTDGIALAYMCALTAANKLDSSTSTYSSLTSYASTIKGAAASVGAL